MDAASGDGGSGSPGVDALELSGYWRDNARWDSGSGSPAVDALGLSGYWRDCDDSTNVAV